MKERTEGKYNASGIKRSLVHVHDGKILKNNQI